MLTLEELPALPPAQRLRMWNNVVVAPPQRLLTERPGRRGSRPAFRTVAPSSSDADRLVGRAQGAPD
jgi:hypothetical protein